MARSDIREYGALRANHSFERMVLTGRPLRFVCISIDLDSFNSICSNP